MHDDDMPPAPDMDELTSKLGKVMADLIVQDYQRPMVVALFNRTGQHMVLHIPDPDDEVANTFEHQENCRCIHEPSTTLEHGIILDARGRLVVLHFTPDGSYEWEPNDPS